MKSTINTMCKAMLFAIILVAACSPKAENFGVWSFKKEIDAFKDTSISVATYRGIGASVSLRCDGGDLDMIFSVNEFIGGDFTDVRVRFDKGAVHEYYWSLATSGRAVFARADSHVNLVQGFESAKTMLLEVTKYNGSKYQREISLKGIRQPLNKVLESCPVVDNSITAEKFEQITENIPPEIIRENPIDHGPKTVVCNKEMLASLGYALKDMGPVWTREYFLKLLEFHNDQKSSSNKRPSLYSLATEKNPEFVDRCGSLFGYE